MDRTFGDIMNRSSVDELEERLHDICSKLEKEGYHNLDVAMALVKTANRRAKKHSPALAEAFALRVIEVNQRFARGVSEMSANISQRLEAEERAEDED